MNKIGEFIITAHTPTGDIRWEKTDLTLALRAAWHDLQDRGRHVTVQFVDGKAEEIKLVARFHPSGIIGGFGEWADYVTEKTWLSNGCRTWCASETRHSEETNE